MIELRTTLVKEVKKMFTATDVLLEVRKRFKKFWK